ncbi:MAG: hypothetical protein RL345_2101, partial [Chloroflexota bacterium]
MSMILRQSQAEPKSDRGFGEETGPHTLGSSVQRMTSRTRGSRTMSVADHVKAAITSET